MPSFVPVRVFRFLSKVQLFGRRLLSSPLLASPRLASSPHLSSPLVTSPHLSSPLLTSRHLTSRLLLRVLLLLLPARRDSGHGNGPELRASDYSLARTLSPAPEAGHAWARTHGRKRMSDIECQTECQNICQME